MTDSLPRRRSRPQDDTRDLGHRVILVSGDKHCGQTTLVETLISSLTGRKLRIAGILAKGLWNDNLRAGFDVVNLADGCSTPLARRRICPHPRHRMMFDFLATGMQAGLEALAPASCRQADVIVVDELGRLEAGGDGWAPCIEPLLALDTPRLFILIVRADCLPQICARFGLLNAPVIDAAGPRAFDLLCKHAERALLASR